MTQQEQKILTTIGSTFKKRREEIGMSKYRLSKLSGVQPMHITLIEQGLINPTIQTLEAMARALGVMISFKNMNE